MTKVRVYPRPTLADITRLIEGEIAAGRHSRTHQTVCSGCREWVDGIYHVLAQDRNARFCRACAAKMGVK